MRFLHQPLQLLLLFCCLGHAFSQAAEIDSFSQRQTILPDSKEAIDTFVNARLSEAIEEANTPGLLAGLWEETPCNPDRLYTALQQALFQSSPLLPNLKGYSFDLQLREYLADTSRGIPLAESIYRDIDYLQGVSLNLKELSRVANLSGYLVGLDKLGHFFAEGWEYHQQTREGSSLEAAMTWGQEKERGLYGQLTTGIYSHADLVANFHGWRFWQRVLGHGDDPLQGFWANLWQRPYVRCRIQILASIRQLRVVRAWEAAASFRLEEYLDPMWDEANNCNSYASPDIEMKVTQRMTEAFPGNTCPLHPESCQAAARRYGAFSSRLLHPACQRAGLTALP